jgi:hypothetical protein
VKFSLRSATPETMRAARLIIRNRAIRAYLPHHDGLGVVRAIKDPLFVNCKTGEEIPRR